MSYFIQGCLSFKTLGNMGNEQIQNRQVKDLADNVWRIHAGKLINPCDAVVVSEREVRLQASEAKGFTNIHQRVPTGIASIGYSEALKRVQL